MRKPLLFPVFLMLAVSVVLASRPSMSVGANGSVFTPLTPDRLLDTRAGSKVGEIDGSGSAYSLQVTGEGGVPSSGVAAVALNVTVVDGEAGDFGGFVTVFPCGTRPDASNLNFTSGQTIPNAVIAPVSSSGKVCFYVYGKAHLLADVSGYLTDESSATAPSTTAPSTTAPETPTDRGTLRIGGLLPQTGNLAFLHAPAAAGAELAIGEINLAGGIFGEPVVWIPGDSGTNGTVATATVGALLTQDVDAILGGISSGVSLSVIDQITDSGVIQFSPSNSSGAFTNYSDHDLYFRSSSADALQGVALADLIYNVGDRSLAILAINEDYGTDIWGALRSRFSGLGGDVSYELIYDPTGTNFATVAANIAVEDPDAIALVGFNETETIIRELTSAGFTPFQMYGVDGNYGNALASQFAAGALDGMRGVYPGVDISSNSEFVARLREIDADLTSFDHSAQSYDAVMVIALAALQADSADAANIAPEINSITRDGTACTTFAACAALIAQGANIDYDGISGPLDFRDAGEPSSAIFRSMEFFGSNLVTDEEFTASFG